MRSCTLGLPNQLTQLGSFTIRRPAFGSESDQAVWFPRFEPEDGVCEVVRFDSPFQPVHPAQHKRYLRHDRNRVAYARMVRHRDGPRPTIVAIHGFTAEGYLINEWFFALPWFYRMGCDIVLFTLPFHGPRQTRFSPFSGHGFFAGGSSRFNEAVAQSVFDFRILLRWLRNTQGVEQVGVTGLSLGGFISAMLASVERELAFALPNVPIISVADLVPRVAAHRRAHASSAHDDRAHSGGRAPSSRGELPADLSSGASAGALDDRERCR